MWTMRSWTVFAYSLITLAGVPGCVRAGQAPARRPGPHALLIGCSTYSKLGESAQLIGPGNDVELFRRVLTAPPYHFSVENMVTLSDASGKRDPDLRPIRANIEREFRNLAEVVRPGEQVVITFSGHGSQQPDQDPPDPGDPEPDGLDEILLPADVGEWDARRRTMANAIVDDELKVWLRKIADRGVLLWVVIDACHSGTVLRADTEEVNRRVNPETLGVPIADLERAALRQAAAPADRDVTPLELAARAPSMVAIYAAMPNEPTPEGPPPGGSDRRPYGLLSYTLCRCLIEAVAPLSYVGLVERIRAKYAARGRTHPTPLVEGTRRDEEVLGARTLRVDSPILLGRVDAGRRTINAGALHGLTEGSVLAVSPPAGERDPGRPLGHVRIKPNGLEPFRAEVEPVRYGTDLAANPDLPTGGRCVPEFIDFGDLRLGVAVKVPGRADAAGDAGRALGRRVDAVLQAMATDPTALVRKVDPPGPGDWVARVEQDREGRDQLYLGPATGKVRRNDGVEESSLFGPAPQDDTLADWLGERVRRIARATNLLRLAGQGQEATSSGVGGPGVDFGFEIRKYRDKTDTIGAVVKPGPGGVVLRDGDRIAFRLVNPGREALDLSLLFIDSNLGIEAVFPEPDVVMDNRLPPGKTLTTLPWNVRADKSAGLEHLVVIAVRAKPGEAPVDFGGLAQPALERARGDSPRAFDSPLGLFLQAAIFGEGPVRGLSREPRADHAVRLSSWLTVR